LLFVSVRVTADVPPDAIEVGLKAFMMVGAARTVRLAVLLADPAGVWSVVTPDVVLGCTPGVLLVTLKITVQLLFAAMLIPVNVRLV
jgi:hypothetical protein